MIVYSATKAGFREDVFSNNIDEIVLQKFHETTGNMVGDSERKSWENSLQYMDRVLSDDEIPDDAGVSIEYHIPRSSKRVDFIITGLDQDNKESVVIIELKQWSEAKITDKDAIVTTRFKHGEKETSHPSYQAWSYKKLLEDYNETVEQEEIKLTPCAYLHNYKEELGSILTNSFYKEYTDLAPLFMSNEAAKLRDFIKQHVKYGDKSQIMYRIDHGKIRPSKNLADQLASMLKGNQEFVMIDDQKIVYETARSLARKSSEVNKQVLIVQGGPGTGKTVVAINLLVDFINQQLNTQYVTKNSAPRTVYEKLLTGSFKKSHISNLFSGSGSYHSLEANTYNALIVDEAHRLNEKSGLFSNMGENQVKEIINSAEFSIFFIDEDQKVTLKDIGTKEEIRKFAAESGAQVTELELESQFRCNGSDSYLAWLDHVLQIHNTANFSLEDIDYDFQIFDDPQEMHNLISEKNKKNNKARMVAGYCWDWVSKNDDSRYDIQIGDYKVQWNLGSDGQSWIIQPNSVSEIGCIHTCQGLEVDYVGVIIGPDFLIRNGVAQTHPEERAKTDASIKGWKKRAKEDPEGVAKDLDVIIKNTYRTLMTRGTKGCYVYFTDKETEQYFRDMLSR